jgi:hypothetical protein
VSERPDPADALARIDLGIPGIEDAVEIGRGGLGVVYRARQSELRRTYDESELRYHPTPDSRAYGRPMGLGTSAARIGPPPRGRGAAIVPLATDPAARSPVG